MADYTFYFPGWRAYIDGRETTIQFQDPEYRGVITYYVPSGEHRIDLLFTDTKVRKFGIVISIFSIVSFFAILFFLNRYR
jgi:hypothetical protein